MADDAGALLVRSGLVSPSALDEARARAASQGGTIGEALVAAGALSDDALTEFYHQRLLVPQVNPNTLARLPIRVVAAIPSDMAVELRVIPVSIDADNNLTVAMSDPSDRHAVDEIAFFTGAYVVRAVATQMQIAWCLAHYYGHITALGQKLLQPAEPEPVPTKQPGSALEPALTRPRPRGVTDQIQAERRRAIPPVDDPKHPVDAKRPTSKQVAAVTPPAPATETAAATVGETTGQTRAKSDTLPEDEPETTSAPATAAPDKDQPRARSISGEIRVPSRRAASIKPPLPEALEPDDDEDDEPQITVVQRDPDNDATGPRMVPVRRRRAKTDPPELAARAGEVLVDTGPVRKMDLVVDEPRIIINDEPSGPQVSGELRVVEHRESVSLPATTIEVLEDTTAVLLPSRRREIEQADDDAANDEPVLLDRRRSAQVMQAQSPEEPVEQVDEEIIVLPPKKPATKRHRSTQVGIGANPATRLKVHDTVPTGLPSALDEDTTTQVDTTIAPASDDISDEIAEPPKPARRVAPGDDTSPRIKPPAPAPAPAVGRPTIHPRRATTNDEDAEGSPTSVMSAAELDEVIPERNDSIVPAHLAGRRRDADESWGPPGTTIPPPLLGALPGTDDDEVDGSARIPMGNIDSAPLLVAAPTPPEQPGAVREHTSPTLVRALEEATARTLELIRTLERTESRDQVVRLMIAHLAESHRRAGFFSIKSGELAVFAIHPKPELIPVTALRLDRPSTLQDVVGTRLPYRGPMLDDASKNFLAAALGATPPEILLVPVAVRERVVGVLFGEHRQRHTFDDQLALAARAAGMALERILKQKRT
ncbi:MAG TPA: hypothetical protein VFQ53_39655 [Kofleriaceae bacterium]|nr:hypothetical protein [Kofleriaceae bacterium]